VLKGGSAGRSHTHAGLREGLDNIVGIVNTKDLFFLFSAARVVILEDALYPAMFLREDESVANALRLFRKAPSADGAGRDAAGRSSGGDSRGHLERSSATSRTARSPTPKLGAAEAPPCCRRRSRARSETPPLAA